MMRGRSDGGQKKRLIASVCAVALLLCFVYMYYGSSNQGASALEYGRSLRKLGSSYLGGDDDDNKQDGSVTSEEDSLAVAKSFPVCDDRHSEIIPCLDRNFIYQSRLKLDLSLMEHYERHCPPPERKFNCLIPPPSGYKVPIKWPKSRDEVWQANIPHTHLAKEKSDQNWMVVKGDKINFPGGGTHFHYGADKYIASIANMLNFSNDVLNDEGRLRTVLDVGCGVASFGAYLLSSDIIAMSLAPNDVHQNQIQFALERGIPAYLGVLGTKRLPYPSRSFELAHCSRCRIDWLQRDGILLLELDRVLRPGGYFAYSSPEAYAQDEEDLRIWKEMSALVERMCWRIAAKRNQTVVWQKPLSNDCYLEREPGTQPPLCRSDADPDAVYGVSMEACITPYSKHDHKTKGSGLAPWPARMTSPPPRLAVKMASRKALINIHRIIRSTAVVNRRSVIPAAAARSHPTFRNGIDFAPRFFCGNTSSPQNFDIDLSSEEKKRITINRLLYRSKQRGFLELDLVLGNWVEENVNSMDENTVKSLIHVLDLENPDLWKWLTGQEQPPEIVSSNPVFLALHKKVMTNLNKHAAPETRAEAGQPWVKGWDDFKRGRDAPISGNQ